MSDKLITGPLGDDNPITIQALGVCSALAVTGNIENALIMGAAVTVITACSNVTVSALRNYIPGRIRMIVQLVVIAFLVTVVSLLLQAFSYDLSKELSVYVGLIITNCILMGRLEAFALGNTPWPSFKDGIGNGLGYALILLIVGAIRELLGTGSLLGFTFFGEEAFHNISFLKHGIFNDFFHNGLAVLPIASIFILGILIWIQRSRNEELIDIS